MSWLLVASCVVHLSLPACTDAQLASFVQFRKADEAWQKERAQQQERIERLQKVNQQRRQVADDLQAQLAGAQQEAAQSEKVCRRGRHQFCFQHLALARQSFVDHID